MKKLEISEYIAEMLQKLQGKPGIMQCILEFGILAELFIIMCLLAVIWQQICEKKGGTDEQN